MPDYFLSSQEARALSFKVFEPNVSHFHPSLLNGSDTIDMPFWTTMVRIQRMRENTKKAHFQSVSPHILLYLNIF